MAPMDERLRDVERKVVHMQLELAGIRTGMYVARWIVGILIALLAIAIGAGR